jgi:23S rRNA (adenine1618-N6)-methyltransferase
VLPYPSAHTIAVPLMTAEWAGRKVDSILTGLDVRWQWRASQLMGVTEAKENVWGRAARRRKKFGSQSESKDVTMADHDDGDDNDEEPPPALAVKIEALKEKVEVRWLRGTDHVLFESFCGMLKRSLAAPE